VSPSTFGNASSGSISFLFDRMQQRYLVQQGEGTAISTSISTSTVVTTERGTGQAGGKGAGWKRIYQAMDRMEVYTWGKRSKVRLDHPTCPVLLLPLPPLLQHLSTEWTTLRMEILVLPCLLIFRFIHAPPPHTPFFCIHVRL